MHHKVTNMVKASKRDGQASLLPGPGATLQQRCIVRGRSGRGSVLWGFRLGSPVVPLTFFCVWFPLSNNHPRKKGALIIAWLLGYHVGLQGYKELGFARVAHERHTLQRVCISARLAIDVLVAV